MTAPNLRLRHVLLLATARAMSRKYMVLSGRSMVDTCVGGFSCFPCGDMFFIFGVSLLVAGDDIFALLICDEDLEKFPVLTKNLIAENRDRLISEELKNKKSYQLIGMVIILSVLNR